jgi:hypothetical protein
MLYQSAFRRWGMVPSQRDGASFSDGLTHLTVAERGRPHGFHKSWTDDGILSSLFYVLSPYLLGH